MKKSPYLIGHEKIWQQLEQQYVQGRLSHALIFLGIEGIGKKKLAFKLSQKLLGLSEEDFSPLLEAQHPDFIWIKPENRRIKIEAIRELGKQLNFAPFQAKNRVILIEDAHCLNTAAANALLKNLEEPAPGNYFFLITHASGWLPKTIVSRTQKIYFSPLAQHEVQAILTAEGFTCTEEEIATALGSPLKAMQAQALSPELFNLEKILASEGQAGLSFGEATRLCETIVEKEQTELFLQRLLEKLHHNLTQNKINLSNCFDRLTFAERILELKENLRLNLNAKMHLTRLLLYFQEPKKSRL